MLKALFGNKNKGKWEVTIKNGDMIRCCCFSGKYEYRDTISRCWIPFNTHQELERLRTHSLVLPE